MILDIIFLAVIIIFIISGAIRGFARAIMNIAAVVASAILSNLLSGVISDWIFNSFVRNDLIANLNNAVTNTEISVNSALGDLPGWVSSVVSFFCNLFNFDEQRLVDCFVGTASTAKLSAVQVTDNFVKPIVTGIFSFFIAIILFILFLIFNCIKNLLFISCLSKVEQGILAIKGIRKKKIIAEKSKPSIPIQLV